jgi:hypothetical protein
VVSSRKRCRSIGKGIPQRRTRAESPSGADDILLQTLLEPSLATVKLSWLLWLADGKNITIAENLADLTTKLENALTRHHGQFMRPAQTLLAYAHEMRGKIAFDQLRYIDAMGHFQEMFDLGEEIHDPNIMALAQIHRADILFHRGIKGSILSPHPSTEMFVLSTPNYCMDSLINPTRQRVHDHVHHLYWRNAFPHRYRG